MWWLGTRFSGELGSAGLMVGLDDLQSKTLNYSVSKIAYGVIQWRTKSTLAAFSFTSSPCSSLCLFVLNPLDYPLRYCVTGEFEHGDESNPCFENSSTGML